MQMVILRGKVANNFSLFIISTVAMQHFNGFVLGVEQITRGAY